MPGYQGHLAGAAVIGAACIFGAVQLGYIPKDYSIWAALMGFILMGSLFPDIDTDSVGQRLFYTVMLAVDIGFIYHRQYQYAAWLGVFAILPGIGKHRGWTHSWWAMLMVGLPILFVPYLVNVPMSLAFHNWDATLPYYVAFTLGYFTHLLFDGEF